MFNLSSTKHSPEVLKKSLLIMALGSMSLVSGCNSSSSTTSSTVDSTDTTTTATSTTSTASTTADTSTILDVSLFRSIVSSGTTTCTLSNGASTTCHKLVFKDNVIHNSNGDLVDDDAGPFCPSGYTMLDGGVGIYDGASGPGFQSLTQTLWDNMAKDGYDLIDEVAGTVCIQDPRLGTTTGENCTAACLNASANDALTVTYLIPVTPQNTTSPAAIGSVQPVGLSLDGIPFTGTPPSVVTGPTGMAAAVGGNIPSLDYCGGHHDPAGYYHWHLIPEAADKVHQAHGTDNLANCGNKITQSSTALTGYAKDGYPIYSYADMVNGVATTPTDLDGCNGHTSVTAEFPDGIYHYHASLDAPNMPTCVKGAFVDQRSSPIIK